MIQNMILDRTPKSAASRTCFRTFCGTCCGTRGRAFFCALLAIAVLTLLVDRGNAQGGGYERTFPQSKATIEKLLKEIPFSLAGRLPVLDGFALPGDRPLDRYQRGYFQSSVQVTAAATGGSVVHVSTKVTAWYPDPIPSRSGYQLLTSNGRIEADLLDELASELGKLNATTLAGTTPAGTTPAGTTPAGTTPAGTTPATKTGAAKTEAASVAASAAPVAATPSAIKPPTPSPSVAAAPPPSTKPVVQSQPTDTAPSAPTPRLPETGGTFSSSVAQGLAAQAGNIPAAQTPPGDSDAGLRAEAASLEEILKNQAHPRNLVAVKKSGTPVVDSASLSAKTLFLASEHDEFEMLDYTADWVHVRISGLSRGWIWRTGLEMPDEIPNVDAKRAAAPTAADLFHVVREEVSTFPGDWTPLRGKSVKIISVEKIDDSKSSSALAKWEFAKSVLEQRYADLAKDSPTLAGIVLIFDSADGGMVAVTLPVLQQWKAGILSDAALWHQSFFDPPETFTPTAASPATQ